MKRPSMNAIAFVICKRRSGEYIEEMKIPVSRNGSSGSSVISGYVTTEHARLDSATI